MDINNLKLAIESNDITRDMMVFQYSDDTSYFLCLQYIDHIIKNKNCSVVYSNDLTDFMFMKDDIFNVTFTSNDLNVLFIDCIDKCNDYLLKQQDVIIVCKSIDKKYTSFFEDKLIVFPKLLDWQIYDYVYSMLTGIEHKQLDELISLCHKNIFRIQQEINKLVIFPEGERKYIFKQFMDEDIFCDLTVKNVFDFTNALLKKDNNLVRETYKELTKLDYEPIGIVTLLLNNIHNIISIQLTRNATPEKCNIPVKQFWAIKNNMCGYYSRDQLISILSMLNSLDYMLKTGSLEISYFIDYIVCHMLSF